MEDRESLARKQDELLSEHLSSVGGYSLTPPPSQPRMSKQQYPQRIYQQQQHQHVPQQLAQGAPQVPYAATQQDALTQQLQQQRPLNGPYAGLQPRLSMRLPPGPALAIGSIYQGCIPARPTPGIPTSQQPVGRSPVMRSNTIYSTQMASVPRYPPQRQQLMDRNDHQKRQYQQYEQQQHYHREPSPMTGADLSAVRPSFGPVPYRQSTYQGVYNGSQQTRLATPRQQQIQQMQAQRPMSLGPISPTRFSVAREMLPIASSSSVLSAMQPAPVFPEPPKEVSSATGTDFSLSTSSPGSGIVPSSIPQEGTPRNPNHNSSYSLYSPVMERTRPRSTVTEPSRIMLSPLTLHASIPATSLNNLARQSVESQRSSTLYSIPSSKSRSSHAQSFSRQVTLSSISAKEEIPPMPGKMTSKTGKVRIQLTFDRPYFNAGGELSGRLEIQCSSSRSVKLADMFIELLGYEDVEGYWLARKGRTIFPFRLNIQDSLPNSYDSKLGQVRYVASAIACMKAHQVKEVVNHTREVFIYETWTTDDITQARRKSVKADTSKRLFMGGDGSLEMYAELTRTMVSSGGIVYVNVGVKNLTKKKIMGIKLSLWRHIAASHSRSSTCSQSSTNGSREQDSVKNYSEIIYKGEDYAFDNDDPRLVVLPVYIPSGVYSLRNTTLLHVQFFIQVSLLASMSKALTVELPLYITHASSWSDPPPRIPRDFTFPLHEDEPVKKHKTGVFAKKRPSSNASQTSGGIMSPRKQPCSIISSSAPTSKAGTPMLTATETPLADGNGSRPITRRSPLKDPDSPTSVLDFSQAGNLFVVNPDFGSITASDPSSMLKQPVSSWSSPIVHIHEFSDSPVSSSPSSPLDRSAPLVLAEQEPLKDEDHGIQEVVDDEEDFDMSRSVNPQLCPSKKDQEKSKPGKMGLRKTLAKLSISIPTHNTGICSNHGKPSKISPRVLPTTPRSTKSQLNSSDEMSADSRSPGTELSLSRESSISSLGSFTSRFDKFNRKSSIGSTRVMTVSPGPVSPQSGQIRSLSSRAKSASTSMPNSTAPSANASGASSPVTQSSPSSSDSTEDQSLEERKRDTVHLSMAAAVPKVLLHQGIPLQEDAGRVSYFQDGKDQSRSTTPSPFDHGVGQDQSAPSTPSSPRQPWQLQRNFSSSSTASSLLEPHETPQTAQGIRDEFYFGKGASRNASTESFVTRVAPAQTGIQSQEHAIYTTDGKIYDEPLTATLIDPSAVPPLPPRPQPVPYTDTPAMVMNTTEQPAIPQQHQEQQHQQILHGDIPRQPSWTPNQYEDGRNYQGPQTPSCTVPLNSSNTPPTQVSSGHSSRVASRQPSPAQRTIVPSGLMLTPAQSPEGYYGDLQTTAYLSRANAPEWTEMPSLINPATQPNIDPSTLGLSGAAPIQYISQSNPPPLPQDPTYSDQGQSYVPVSQIRTPLQYQTPQMVAPSQDPGPQVQQVQVPSIHVLQISQIQHVVTEEQYTQDVYSTSMIPSAEPTMRPEQVFLVRTPEAATPPESKGMYAVPQAVVSLSSAYHPVSSRMSPNDTGIGSAGGPLRTGSYNRSDPSSPSYLVDPAYQVVSQQPLVMAEQLQYANHALKNTLYKDDVRAQPYQPLTQYSPNSGAAWNLESKSQVVSPQPMDSGYYTGTEQQLHSHQVQPDQQSQDRQQQQQPEEQQRLEVPQRAQDQLILQEQVQLREQARLHEQIRLQEQSILQEQLRLQEQRILNEQQRNNSNSFSFNNNKMKNADFKSSCSNSKSNSSYSNIKVSSSFSNNNLASSTNNKRTTISISKRPYLHNNFSSQRSK
ncbi:hypothetical protein BG006_004393 [Podila minutissima]|uniref:Arrestin C-terminal-like domain-containing protein n=1 Tax=Podila minutissima TaxID=64525 RepID=A0A9P5VMR2_9FUNG|nr:hypothetical protein BG006_004393 [Podila minutissima]